MLDIQIPVKMFSVRLLCYHTPGREQVSEPFIDQKRNVVRTFSFGHKSVLKQRSLQEGPACTGIQACWIILSLSRLVEAVLWQNVRYTCRIESLPNHDASSKQDFQ